MTYNYPASTSIEVTKSWLDSPATRLGTYDVLGLLTLVPGSGALPTIRTAAPGEFSMDTYSIVDVQSRFRLNALTGILPASATSLDSDFESSWDINSTVAYHYLQSSYGDLPQDLGERLTALDKASGKQLFSYDFARGLSVLRTPLSGSANQLEASLKYDIGYSYVALGEWSWKVIDPSAQAVAGSDSGSLLFVNGDRTPSSGIPVSGTATYDARTLNGWVSVPFSLMADFGQRTMSASILQDYRYDPAGDILDNPLAYGIHVSGSAPFSADGLFNIPLNGTVNGGSYPTNTPSLPAAEAVTGSMNGAFFGPHAEQVGGIFELDRANGSQLFQDAFVGQQRP
ncbi:MAG: transferrin-binding protein-like solute binding protein [Pseudomonadota bacterium]